MKYKTKFVEEKHPMTPKGIRNLFHYQGYGQAHERKLEITKESKEKADEIVDSHKSMIELYRELQRKSGEIVSFYKAIQSIHGDIVKHALERNIEINEEIDTAIYNRVKNTVIGFFAQDYGQLLFLDASKEILVLSNDDCDLKEGEESIIQKELVSTKRNFLGHCHLFYGKGFESELNFLVDEASFFTLNYLRKTLKTWTEDKTKGISIDDNSFKEEIKKYKGEWKFSMSNKLHEEYAKEAEEIIAFLED